MTMVVQNDIWSLFDRHFREAAGCATPIRKFLTGGLAGFSLLALAGCLGDDADAGRKGRTPTVGYVVAKPSSVPVPVTLGGRVVAYQTSEVRPQVSGLVKRINFEQGSYVKAGQPLFQIDPSLYQAAVSQAQANLASAQANAAAAKARADRFEPLAKIEAVSQQDYADAVAASRAAQAAVAQGRAALETAKINLRFTTVPAPISGRIGRTLFTVGALVSSSQADPLAVIQQADPVYVDMQQSASDLTRLRQKLASGGALSGSTVVHLTLDDGTRYAYTGAVQFSEVTVSEDTGTVTLRARFPNPDGLLLPGTFVNALFDQATNPNAFLVPQQSLKRDFNGASFVQVIGKGDKVERRAVTTDRAFKDQWVITSGLKAGDKVITQAQDTLKAGTTVKPVPASTPQRTGVPQAGKAGGGAKGTGG